MPIVSMIVSAVAGVALAATGAFTLVQVTGDGSSDQGAISAPLVEYGAR
ncbi:MAG: hypothetical protein OEV62_07275 [Actinomycetota bacterium]|jgi:hypothetical protein|nr:hypothetical protein [Actinomycetota bacterium]MDH5278343.1 hypothetical protein [Actinomycetota bacterium]HUW17377.1 hypothetical protein [Actinomycetes bacterium]